MKKIKINLPPIYNIDLLPEINEAYLTSAKTIIVLDDDPTGTQTSYNLPVLTQWDVPTLMEELTKKPLILFILSNSRSLPEGEAVVLTHQIGENLKRAMMGCKRDIVLISRSDSTLRGHFPAEVHAIVASMNLEEAVWVLIPAFIEGGRYTIDDVHYIRENDQLIPVAQSPFAKDLAFGYIASNLKEWVEEKSKGKIKATEVITISLTDIREGGPETVCQRLLSCNPGTVCIVNACETRDLEVFALGSMQAESLGKKFVFRSSATFVPIRAGIPSGKDAIMKEPLSDKGSLTIVGSYVSKTTEQLNYLIAKKQHFGIEVDVQALLSNKTNLGYIEEIISKTDELLKQKKDVVIFTSRELAKGDSPESSLKINGKVSEFLTRIVKGISVRPSFIIAKGGITSSDVAVKGLEVKKAMVLGQIWHGIPVWELDRTSRFPNLTYVIFPGNVGNKFTLWEVFNKLKANH